MVLLKFVDQVSGFPNWDFKKSFKIREKVMEIVLSQELAIEEQ